jgi:divalent metal cation (Fe/Co/Zn/Cd) transporter
MDQNKSVNAVQHQELPRELQKHFNRAVKLEWITIGYMISVILVMAATMQSSQAMKAALFEDVLSILPAASFLVAKRFYNRPANSQFPFGYHRVYTIAFQTGALALFSIGMFVLYDSASTLIKAERPTIGTVSILGRQIWHGWIMILALLYSAIPAMILGYKKLPIARKLHNKTLFTDAHTQQADWLTAFAAVAGIIGVGFGLWWADAVAACFISVNIVWDGFKSQNWSKDVRVRMREAGEVFFTEVFIIPTSTDGLLENISKAVDEVKQFDWKLYDVVVIPVSEFTTDEEQAD